MKTYSTLLFLLLFLTLNANMAFSYVSGGHEYDLICNANGHALSSKYPITRTVNTEGYGAATRYISGFEKLYLGRSCDALHSVFGEGEWCWANGGFGATFVDSGIWFARQELFCTKRTT